jgi:hypothetical protein
MDIFEALGITDEFGNQLTEKNLNPLMGYQIVHRETGRILPHTQRYEIMGNDYATKKLLSITQYYVDNNMDFPFGEYRFEPVYLVELDESLTGFILLYTEKDEKQFGLFR